VNQLIGDAGVCRVDTDCVFLTDGGPYSYDGYTEDYVNPVSLPNVESFTTAVQGMICGYQNKCDAGGQPQIIQTGIPSNVPQSQYCLSCELGQCTPNQVFADSGS
jgi:hypothetical protein